MEKKDSILINYKAIDYEGLKMEQSLMEFCDLEKKASESKEFVQFDDIFFGLLSIN